jgi:subtilisin family serine protease
MQLDIFEIVEPVYVQKSFFMPNDPLIVNQYYLNIIKANQAWDVTQGSPSIIIGIVDTGGDLNHPDLQGNIYIDPADPTDGIDNDGDGYIDNNRGWDFSGADAALIGSPNFKGDNDPSVFSGNKFGHGTMVAGCASATTNDAVGISGVGLTPSYCLQNITPTTSPATRPRIHPICTKVFYMPRPTAQRLSIVHGATRITVELPRTSSSMLH